MFKRKSVTLLSAIAGVAIAAWSCDGPPAAGPQPDRPRFWEGGEEGCATTKFTGGGRIDPLPPNTLYGKVTFGFNVQADEQCNVIKGDFEVVHHPTQTKYHSESFEPGTYVSFTNETGGECFNIRGTMRSKHGNDDWHPHTFFIQACDNGEGKHPGTAGPDTFWFETTDGTSTPGHGGTGRTPLTGGNIQAH